MLFKLFIIMQGIELSNITGQSLRSNGFVLKSLLKKGLNHLQLSENTHSSHFTDSEQTQPAASITALVGFCQAETQDRTEADGFHHGSPNIVFSLFRGQGTFLKEFNGTIIQSAV